MASVVFDGWRQSFRRTMGGMRYTLLWLVVLFGGCMAGCSAETSGTDEPPAPALPRVPYYVNGTELLGEGAYRISLACTTPGDTVTDGTCTYQNGGPEEGTRREGIDASGFFCAGRSPAISPYGWVNIRIHCEPSP